MASLNKVMLIGRLIDNPEPPRTLPNSGTTVVKFRFAVGRSRKNPQTGQWENDPNPLYIDCEAFHRSDSRRDIVNLISQYVKKGDQIYIEGRLQYDTWEDKNNPGQKRSKHKIVVEQIELLSGRGGDGEGGGGGGRGYGGGGGGGNYGGGGGGNYGGGRPAQNTGYSAPPDDHPDDQGDVPF